MPAVRAYHRPSTIAEALALLPNGRILAGGTVVNTSDTDPVDVIDLQALGLDAITATDDGRLSLGAMTRLQQVADHPQVPAVLADLARRELPSTLRTIATVGGTAATDDPESGFIAGLLAFDAHLVTVGSDGERTTALADGLAPGRIITAVTVTTDGTAATERTGRTPADTPIVSAVARKGADGTIRLALTGVADRPVLVDAGDPTAGLEPPDDFRGDADYRRHLAAVLSARVLGAL